MSYGIQTTQLMATIEEITLTTGETEEIAHTQIFIDSTMPEAKEETKHLYAFSQKPIVSKVDDLGSHILHAKTKTTSKRLGHSPMHLASRTYGQTAAKGKTFTPSVGTSSTHTPSTPQVQNHPKTPKAPLNPFSATSQQVGQKTPPKATRSVQRTAVHTPKESRARSRSEHREQASSLQARRWVKQETAQWWQQRYHQKEREGQGNRQGHDQQEPEQQPDKKKKKRISGIGSISANRECLRAQLYGEKKKPVLQKPRTGIFALYYILTKIGIHSDGSSNFSYKKEIETIDSETTSTHKKRLDELKVAIEKEKEAAQWGIAAKVFSWIGSLISILAGVVMIATGVGAVAGAMMVAGGLIQITNQLLSITGGWKKIAELLPGENSEKKRAVINWMQIGVAVLCLILSGVGIFYGGYANFGEAMQTVSMLFGSIIAMGQGTTTIGEGVTVFMFKNKMSEMRRYDKILAELKHKRRDLLEKVEWGVDRLEQLFEDLAKALEFEIELFRADQMVNR